MKTLATLPALILALSMLPASADWPTIRFLPVPTVEKPKQALAKDDFGFFSDPGGKIIVKKGGTTVFYADKSVGRARFFELTEPERIGLRRGATAALVDVTHFAALDASKMQAAGFPAPVLEPTLRTTNGSAFYPLFWVTEHTSKGKPGFRGQYDCEPGDHVFARNGKLLTYGLRKWIALNGDIYTYASLKEAREKGGSSWENAMASLTGTIAHEVVHAVQENSNDIDKEDCHFPVDWWTEGIADGVQAYLLNDRISDFFNKYPGGRNDRPYNVSLDTRGAEKSKLSKYEYATGSFFRYVIEASKSSGQNGLSIIKDLIEVPWSRLESLKGALTELDDVLSTHSGDRGLYRILPEFLTEYASYGESRYETIGVLRGKKQTGFEPLSRERWIDFTFRGCVEYNIKPGVTQKKEITVRPLAGECIKVSWSGFTEPVALQFYATDAGDSFGALHLGEAMREDTTGKHFCYDATRKLTRRIAEPMRRKCMLKRETRALGGAGAGVRNEAAWTSDFNLSGSGDVHFVISNIARDPAETKPVTFQLLVGSLEATKIGGAHIKPRTPGGETEPVVSGMTDPRKRVHTMNGAGDRIFFDGRSLFGDGTGLGYLEGVAGALGPGEGPGVMTLVRGGDYWVGYIGARPGHSELGDGGLIIKDPVRLESGNPMAGVIMSAGMERMPSGSECGYKVPAEVSIVEETRERVRFRVSGDLFDPMRAMALGGSGGSTCDLMQAMWVESASFEVSLPNGALHAGDSWVERRSPPGQEVYDETDFLSGPNLGGIATSLSLGANDAPPDDDSDAPPDDSDATSGGAGGSASRLDACDCRCPDAARPDPAASPKPQCVAQCATEWAACRASGDAALARGAEPEPARREPTLEAQRKWFSRLVSDQGLAPEVEAMLVDDFATMSAETRMHLIREYRRGLP